LTFEKKIEGGRQGERNESGERRGEGTWAREGGGGREQRRGGCAGWGCRDEELEEGRSFVRISFMCVSWLICEHLFGVCVM